MYYEPALGVQGNIERSLEQCQYISNGLINEKEGREQSDYVSRESIEQTLTDNYLDNVQAQQDITELQLEVEELKRRNEA